MTSSLNGCKVIMRPEQRLTMSEQAAAVRTPITTCPKCGALRFYADPAYYLTDGTKRRTRKCPNLACGYARTETVPEPIVDGEPESADKTLRSESSDDNPVEEPDVTP